MGAAKKQETKAKHTPGPWRVYPAGSSVPHYDVCDRIVADVPTGRSAYEGPSDADARLIAAAPELLEALETLMEYADNGTPVHPGSLDWDQARAALAKARGEG